MVKNESDECNEVIRIFCSLATCLGQFFPYRKIVYGIVALYKNKIAETFPNTLTFTLIRLTFELINKCLRRARKKSMVY